MGQAQGQHRRSRSGQPAGLIDGSRAFVGRQPDGHGTRHLPGQQCRHVSNHRLAARRSALQAAAARDELAQVGQRTTTC